MEHRGMTRKTASQSLTREEKDYLRELLSRPAPNHESENGELTISGQDAIHALLDPFVGSEGVQLHAHRDGLTLISDLKLEQNAFTQQVSLRLHPPEILDTNGQPRNLRVGAGARAITLQDGQQRFTEAELLDISVTGASIASSAPSKLRVGDVLAPLRLSVDPDESVVLAGEVVRIEQQTEPSRTLISIHFLGHTERSRRVINDYVFQCHSAKPKTRISTLNGNDHDAAELNCSDA